MMYTRTQRTAIPLGWPERFLAGAVVLLFLVLGFVFGTLILGLAAIAGLGFAARLWWLRRRLRRSKVNGGPQVIEGEYRVIERHSVQGQWGGHV